MFQSSNSCSKMNGKDSKKNRDDRVITFINQCITLKDVEVKRNNEILGKVRAIVKLGLI